MPVIRITCPKCAATATGTAARPLPAGKAIKCPRCGIVFRVPPAAPPQPRETQVAAARLLPPRPAPKGPLAKRVIYRVTCPACKVVLKTAAAPPFGKTILCPKCRAPFVTRPRQTKLAGPPRPKETRLGPDPKRPKETKLGGAPAGKEKANGRPSRVLKCTACAAVMRITGTLPAGKVFPCPRCRRPVSATARAAKPPAKKTTLGQQAKRTTLAPTRPKTVLAPQPGSAPPVLPRGSLIRCTHCATAFNSPQAMPVGRLLKCSKCAKTFRAAAVPKPVAKPSAAAKPTRVSRPAPPPRKRSSLGLYLLMALALGAILVVGLGYFDVVPLFPHHSIPDSAWKEFVPPEGGCRIEMPGTPEMVRARAYGPSGIDAKKYVVIRKREDAAFFLAVSDRIAKAGAPASLEAIYAAERDAVMAVAKGRLARQSAVSLDGHLGKEFQIDFPDGAALIGRVYWVKGSPTGRAYVLVATGADVEVESAARFFGSFRIDASEKRR